MVLPGSLELLPTFNETADLFVLLLSFVLFNTVTAEKFCEFKRPRFSESITLEIL